MAKPIQKREAPSQPELEVTDAPLYSKFLLFAILFLICAIAFLIRLFAVVRWESVIHEYDPYFNYRTTKFLSYSNFYEFLNWFDNRSWYPLGRVVGGTIYPGLMLTANFIMKILHIFNLTINVRNMCVFLAPIFASLTSLSTYLLVFECTNNINNSLLSSIFISIVPSYISRSVGGSYDNEGVAIFALIFCFYLWIKACNTGSMIWSAFCSLSYFYMVAAWGGYIFIINIIPIYILIIILCGYYNDKIYIAYSVFYILGSILAMQVPFVGFNVVHQAESIASHGVFVLLQFYAFGLYLKSKLDSKIFNNLIKVAFTFIVGFVGVFIIFLQISGKTQWTGRSLTLLDPTYAKKYIPIIASVSEHQPSSWTSYYFDLSTLVALSPLGIYLLYQNKTYGNIFLILYGTISWWFAGIMVRLLLTLAPVACVLGGIAYSKLLNTFIIYFKYPTVYFRSFNNNSSNQKKLDQNSIDSSTWKITTTSGIVIFVIFLSLIFFGVHSCFVASEAYSSPSIVLSSSRADGSRVILDDYREAYYWMRMNTDINAKFMSWWDYGYQMAGMGNRTVIVDNNTWNNTHIATVGRAMASPEEKAYPIILSLDVDYVLVVFGGRAHYSSDDINKFLWMIRIGQGVYPAEIVEPDFFRDGQYRTDSEATDTMKNSLLYKLSYYRYSEIYSGQGSGYDNVRQSIVGVKDVHLRYFEEAFTSENWIIRIFKVKKPEPFILTDNLEKKKLEWTKASSKDTENDYSMKMIGCYHSELSFSQDKQYIGGAVGAKISVAKEYALSSHKKYIAISRHHTDGHAFVFSRLSKKPDYDDIYNDNDCNRPCSDDSKYLCGCADSSCNGDLPEGDEVNRRWIVYELTKNKKRER